MVPTSLSRTRRQPVDRSTDRLVALAGIVLALLFLAAAVLSLALPAGLRRGLWLPLHLALAGGASSAIAGAMPFFVAAFAAARPADERFRAASVAAVAVGAAMVSIGVVAATVPSVPLVGGLTFIAGVVLTGGASLRPLAGALGPSRGLVTQAYLLALTSVAIGAIVATLYLAGWTPLIAAWGRLRPAHAWLNLVGFVSLVIATTLLHFLPTVTGARIAAHPSARLTVLALGLGVVMVAGGYWLDLDGGVRLGAAATIVGALALVLYAARIWTSRGRWTTDPGWHRFAIGGLASALVWFEIGIAAMGSRAVVFGASPAGWSLDAVVGPLVVGWVGMAILASATHLIPAVGPGDPAAHAAQRTILGSAAALRLVVLNAGVAALTIGLPLGLPMLREAGALLVGAAFAATGVLLVRAIVVVPVQQNAAEAERERV